MTALELELSVVEQHLGAVREGELTIRENVGGVVVVLLVLDVAVHLFERQRQRHRSSSPGRVSSASSKS